MGEGQAGWVPAIYCAPARAVSTAVKLVLASSIELLATLSWSAAPVVAACARAAPVASSGSKETGSPGKQMVVYRIEP